MPITRTRTLIQPEITLDARVGEVACTLDGGADLADLGAAITGEKSQRASREPAGDDRTFVRQRDHAVSVQLGVIGMLDKAIAELREPAERIKEALDGAGAK